MPEIDSNVVNLPYRRERRTPAARSVRSSKFTTRLTNREIIERDRRGPRENGHLTFELRLTGREVYDLQNILEAWSLNSDAFRDVRKSVLLLETMEQQLRDQDYYEIREVSQDR